nr:uncharacterized protein LOC109770823 [Aegilops tauschii subsp. strangulata]
MVLMDKEVQGFVFEDSDPGVQKRCRWMAVGKVCSPRPMKMSALERTMPRAWGLHREAKFSEIGPNIIMVQFGSEGDWRHVLNNGPWQFDFSVLIMKDYEGSVRPSEMVFDRVDVWVRVLDLPPDRRTEAFGRALGNWLGDIVKVDVDREGFARGGYLRVRATISVFDPLVRGFYLKKSKDAKEKTWFDFYYEKVPHFCFDCGRMVHVGDRCVPPLDSADQWGSWLRASPGRNAPAGEGTTSGGSGSFNSRSGTHTSDAARSSSTNPRMREMHTRRNLHAEFSGSGDARTGESYSKAGYEVNSPGKPRARHGADQGRDLRDSLEHRREHDMRQHLMEQKYGPRFENERCHEVHGKGKGKEEEFDGRYDGVLARGSRNDERDREEVHGRRRGTYRRMHRDDLDRWPRYETHHNQPGDNRKRRPKQVWVAKGEQDAFTRETRQKTASVFDRISSKKGNSSADPDFQGRRDQ